MFVWKNKIYLHQRLAQKCDLHQRKYLVSELLDHPLPNLNLQKLFHTICLYNLFVFQNTLIVKTNKFSITRKIPKYILTKCHQTNINNIHAYNIKYLPNEIFESLTPTNIHILASSLVRLDPAIAKWTNLTELYITKSKIQSLPHELNQLHLTKLMINHSHLRVLGSIISNTLIYLDLCHNQLVQISELKCPNLKKCLLSHNRISIIPQIKCEFLNFDENKLASIPQLETSSLKLSFCRFVNFESICETIGLKQLIVYKNKLSLIGPSIRKLQFLISLNLSSNKISTISKEISELKYLKYVQLGNNKIKEIPDFSKCNLCELELSKNQISCIPVHFFNCRKLRKCFLDYNCLSELPNLWNQFYHLDYLFLNNNRLKYIPFTLAQLQFVNFNVENNLKLKLRSNQIFPMIYANSQNVHANGIQSSARLSIARLLKDPRPTNDWYYDVLKDDILSVSSKQIIIDLNQTHILDISEDINISKVFPYIWQRIVAHDSSSTLKAILNAELYDISKVCYTGKLTGLINILSGFYPDIHVQIHNNDQVSFLYHDAINKANGDQDLFKRFFTKEMESRNYSKELITQWIDFKEKN